MKMEAPILHCSEELVVPQFSTVNSSKPKIGFSWYDIRHDIHKATNEWWIVVNYYGY
jgi:hypothetical protein